MEQTIKVVIPMAGLGTRLRPHTWSKPKQLVSVAGKPVLDHVLDMLSTLPDPQNIELINIFKMILAGNHMLYTWLASSYPDP